MMKFAAVSRRSAVVGGLVGLPWLSRAASAASSQSCELVVLTIGGLIGKPNRPAFDPRRDELFDNRGIAFENARAFTLAGIMGFAQVTVRSFTDRGETSFSGVPFKTVLEAAAPLAGAKTVRVAALDGFAADFALAEILPQGWVLAMSEQDKPYGIGDFGPFRWVRSLDSASDWTGTEQQNWVHSIFYIEVTA